MPPKLRKRKPYTCRFTIAGKVCAAFLTEDDGQVCKDHAEAQARFMSRPKLKPVEAAVVVRRIWP